MSSLKKLEERPGKFLSEFDTADSDFEGEKVVGRFTYLTVIVKKLGACLQNRFSDLSDNLLMSTKIADLTSWPLEADGDFGDEAVRHVVDHFEPVLTKQGCSVELMSVEWDHLKQILYENENVFEVSWADVNKKYRFKVPNILDLMDLILTLPASSAECERGFSVMKMTKTDYRNRLTSTSVTKLMVVKLHSADIAEFDPTPAIHYWNASGNRKRRPEFKRRLIQNPAACSLAAATVEGVDQDLEAETEEVEEQDMADMVSGQLEQDAADDDSDFGEMSDGSLPYGDDQDDQDDQDLFDLAYDI